MIGALIMAHSDDRGLILPPKIAPIQVLIVPLKNEEKIYSISEHIKESLEERGVTVDIDYSDKSPGFKFAEAEVGGTPLRIEIGLRDVANNEVTVVRRDTLEKQVIKLNDVVNIATQALDKIQENLYNKALENMKDRTYDASDIKEVEKIMNEKPGFVNAYWCGNEECELKMKEIKGTKSRCIVESDDYETAKCVVCGKKAKHKVVWGIQY
jgi:prolyl-tRNA synthetase